MGQQQSNLRPDQLEEMQKGTNFAAKDVKKLYKRFKKLDKDGNGLVSREEFLMVPELALNPLVKRVIALFDEDNDNNINFKDFLHSLSIFNEKSEKNDKMKFAFRVYDIDNDGYISNGELFTVLKMMVGSNLTDVQLQQIVDKTICEADEDKDGKISFPEFSKVLSKGLTEQDPFAKMKLQL